MRSTARATTRLLRDVSSILVTLGEARSRLSAPAKDRARRLSAAFGELCTIHGIKISLAGKLPSGPAVLVANHLSYLDPVVIGATTPCLPIAKAEVQNWPLLGVGARALGVVFVERARPASRVTALRQAIRVLDEGCNVLNFAEGTTSNGTSVGPFHRGIFGAARIVGCPVVPVALRFADPSMCWIGRSTFLPHYLRTSRKPQITVSLHFGAALDARDYPSAEELSVVTRARLRNLLFQGQITDVATNRSRVSFTRSNAILSPPHS